MKDSLKQPDRSTPLNFPFKKSECGYCGMHNHNTEECHLHLMDTVARTPKEMGILKRLGELEHEALRRGLMMYEIPEAIEIMNLMGLTYEQ